MSLVFYSSLPMIRIAVTPKIPTRTVIAVKTGIDIFLEAFTRITLNSSGKGVAEITPANVGRMYILTN